MKILKIFLLSIFPFLLFAENDPESQFLDFKSAEMQSALTNIGSEPSTIAAGCVNVITGDYVESDTDLTIPAPETFQIQRSYTSSGIDGGVLQKTWQVNHQAFIVLKDKTTKNHKTLTASVKLAHGERLLLEGKEKRHVDTFTMKAPKEHFEKGITNISKGVISAQNNIKNVRLVLENQKRISADLFFGSGEELRFQRIRDTTNYHLKMDRKPTGLRFYYDYDHVDSLSFIEQQNIYNEKVAHCSVHVNLVPPQDQSQRWMSFIAPDGRRVDYLFQCHDGLNAFKILKAVRRSDGPDVDYDIEDAKYGANGNITHGHYARIQRKKLPDNRFVALQYYHRGINLVLDQRIFIEFGWNPKFNRVKQVFQPAGNDGSDVQTYAFIYYLPSGKDDQKSTKVVDALGRDTIYFFNQNDRLTHLVKCNEHKQFVTEEILHWGTKGTSREMNLKGRSFGYCGSHEKIYTRRYTYDEHGNMISESIYGNISGRPIAPLLIDEKGKPIPNGVERNCRIMCYGQDPYHRLLSMQEGEISTSYKYLGNTFHQTECLYSDPSGVFARHFYDVDQNGLVVCHIRDDGKSLARDSLDGVTERTIDRITRSYTYPCGLPLEETKTCLNLQTGQEELIGKKIQRFDLQGRMIYQETYGSDGALAFVKEWGYDAHGNLTLEKNALGHVIQRSFDSNGNCIREEGPMNDSFKTFTYDFMNRLISSTEHHSDGSLISQKFHYDLMGNKIAMVDGLGNTTTFAYDAFNRCIREEGPGTPSPDGIIQNTIKHYGYDPLGNRTQEIDSLGHKTSTTYTILGKPTCIESADGSKEWFYYDLQGRLIEAITKTGAITRYTRDPQGRVTKTSVYSPNGTLFSEAEAGYNSFHMLWEKDPAGVMTHYEYDAAGRLKSIIKNESLTEYEYDSLSRICKTTITNLDKTDGTITFTDQDAEGKVIEERTEDLNGTIYLYKRNTFDALGRKIAVQEGDSVSRFVFDSHGNVTSSIDSEGNETTRFNDYHYFNKYGQHVLKTLSTDPKGIQTATEFNAQGKAHRIQILNTLGETLREEEHYYDPCGQKLQVNMISCKAQGRTAEMRYRFSYDAMKRQISFIQAHGTVDEKITTTSYDLAGMKTCTIKCDGTEIRFKHDFLGRLIERESSDGSVHDQYIYDVKNNPLEVKNLINQTSTTRTFDALGQTTTETLQNQLTTRFSYAYDGSISEVILPDESSVRYYYSAGYLKKAERYKSSGSLDYIHEITEYDTQGRIVKEILPQNCGIATRTYTPNGKLNSYVTQKFSETNIQYDPCNNLLARTLKDLKGTFSETYAYDDLGQLTKEQGFAVHNYSYDGLYNRLSKDDQSYDVNNQNQILNDGQDKYVYDMNGNLIETGDIQITYDALDRPILVKRDGMTSSYSYDEMNRCIERKCQKDELRFIFITQAEVGACDVEGKIIQFQMAGPSRNSAPFQALSIEINGNAYVPHYDQSGHIRVLTSIYGAGIEAYRYSAFGEVQVYNLLGLKWDVNKAVNPWMYGGKRVDPLTNWYQFGRRFYCPKIGRFITQDPAGITASPNLYAYLLNSPIVHHDTYGLFEFAALRNFGNGIAHAGFNIISSIASAPFHIVNNTRMLAGATLEKLSRNLIPINYVKDIPQAAGYFLKNLSMEGYVPSYKEPTSFWITHPGIVKEGVGHFSKNGIMNTVPEGEEFAKKVSEAHGGAQVDHFYGASHGLVQDLSECALQIIGVRTHQVKEFENGLKERINKLGPKGIATIDVHSRGAITLARVLPNLETDQVNRLWICTLGGANLIQNENALHVANFVKSHDPISLIGDPFTYFGSIFGFVKNVYFMKSTSFGFEHGIENYSESLKENAMLFKERYGI